MVNSVESVARANLNTDHGPRDATIALKLAAEGDTGPEQVQFQGPQGPGISAGEAFAAMVYEGAWAGGEGKADDDKHAANKRWDQLEAAAFRVIGKCGARRAPRSHDEPGSATDAMELLERR